MPAVRTASIIAGRVRALARASLASSALATRKDQQGPSDTALVVVDVQKRRSARRQPRSSPRAKKDSTLINRMRRGSRTCRDDAGLAHARAHISFASPMRARMPFERSSCLRETRECGRPIADRDEECGTRKAARIPHAQLIIRKGYNPTSTDTRPS